MAAATASCVLGTRGRYTAEFETTHDLPGEATVSISNRTGPVTVRPAADDQLRVVGTKHAESQAGLEAITLDVVTGEQALVDVGYTAGSAFAGRQVVLTVELPPQAGVNLATTASGDVSVRDVRGNVSAGTGRGTVTVTDVEGYVRAASGNGDVSVDETTGLVSARTGRGRVEATVRSMRQDVSCRSGDGPVTVGVGPDVSAAIRLSATNGTATVRDLPQTTESAGQGHVEGQLRGGESPLLFLRSANGDLLLQPAD